MIQVTPDNLYICLDPSTPLPTAAVLVSQGRSSVPISVPPAPTPGSPLQLGPVPADTQAGVYTLSLTTDCGCYQTPVNVALCPAPAADCATRASHVQPLIMECCPAPYEPPVGNCDPCEEARPPVPPDDCPSPGFCFDPYTPPATGLDWSAASSTSVFFGFVSSGPDAGPLTGLPDQASAVAYASAQVTLTLPFGFADPGNRTSVTVLDHCGVVIGSTALDPAHTGSVTVSVTTPDDCEVLYMQFASTSTLCADGPQCWGTLTPGANDAAVPALSWAGTDPVVFLWNPTTGTAESALPDNFLSFEVDYWHSRVVMVMDDAWAGAGGRTLIRLNSDCRANPPVYINDFQVNGNVLIASLARISRMGECDRLQVGIVQEFPCGTPLACAPTDQPHYAPDTDEPVVFWVEVGTASVREQPSIAGQFAASASDVTFTPSQYYPYPHIDPTLYNRLTIYDQCGALIHTVDPFTSADPLVMPLPPGHNPAVCSAYYFKLERPALPPIGCASPAPCATGFAPLRDQPHWYEGNEVVMRYPLSGSPALPLPDHVQSVVFDGIDTLTITLDPSWPDPLHRDRVRVRNHCGVVLVDQPFDHLGTVVLTLDMTAAEPCELVYVEFYSTATLPSPLPCGDNDFAQLYYPPITTVLQTAIAVLVVSTGTTPWGTAPWVHDISLDQSNPADPVITMTVDTAHIDFVMPDRVYSGCDQSSSGVTAPPTLAGNVVTLHIDPNLLDDFMASGEVFLEVLNVP